VNRAARPTVTRGRRRLRLLAFAGVVAILLAACRDALPQSSLNPAGERAEQVDSLFRLVFWIAVVVFVLVEGALVYALVRFRRRRADEGNPVQVHGNVRLEVLWTIIPALLLLGIAVPTVRTIFDLSSHPSGDAVRVNVVAHQWWWEVEYPDLGVITANEIHVPAGRPVVVSLESEDVIHSFWVPRLAGKQDIIPGRTNAIDFVAAEPGTYLGQCAEYCGLSHALMRFRVIAQEPEEFDAWAQAQLAPVAAQPQGATQQALGACFQCHAFRGLEGAPEPIGGTVEVVQGLLVPFPAPDLTHFASRTTFAGATFELTADSLFRWLENPRAVKPGSRMMDYGLTDDQIEALVAYLLSLR
jgi:cytochrome c oxidase subunit 2